MATLPHDGFVPCPDARSRAPVRARASGRTRIASPWSMAGLAVLVLAGPIVFVAQNSQPSAPGVPPAPADVSFLGLHSPLSIAVAILAPGIAGCAFTVVFAVVQTVRARRLSVRSDAERASSRTVSILVPPSQRAAPETVVSVAPVVPYTVLRKPNPGPSRVTIQHRYWGLRPRPGEARLDGSRRAAHGPVSTRAPGR